MFSRYIQPQHSWLSFRHLSIHGNQNVVKEVRIKLEFLQLSQKAFNENEIFLKMSINGGSNFNKRPNIKSSKIDRLSRMF